MLCGRAGCNRSAAVGSEQYERERRDQQQGKRTGTAVPTATTARGGGNSPGKPAVYFPDLNKNVGNLTARRAEWVCILCCECTASSRAFCGTLRNALTYENSLLVVSMAPPYCTACSRCRTGIHTRTRINRARPLLRAHIARIRMSRMACLLMPLRHARLLAAPRSNANGTASSLPVAVSCSRSTSATQPHPSDVPLVPQPRLTRPP